MKTVTFLGPEYIVDGLREQAGDTVRIIAPAPEESTVAAALRGSAAVLDASMKVRLTDAMLADSQVEIVSCATTGSDHIERGELERRGAPVRTLKEDRELLMGLTPAAELSWALLMACARKIPAALNHVRGNGWDREQFPGIMIKGKQLGVIGLGRIGGWMSRYALAFGARVVGYDPFITDAPESIRLVTLEELVESSDFISIHVHLSPQTQGMVSRDLLSRVKPGAIFINTSRSGVCDEDALLDMLRSGRLAAAGLDVLAGEPAVAANPLVAYARTHDNLIITPHCGGYSPDAVRLVCERAMAKILEHFAGAGRGN